MADDETKFTPEDTLTEDKVTEEEPNGPTSLNKANYEPFDPEIELKALKSFPREEKTQRVLEYKKNLIDQKKGIATIIGTLDQAVHQNSSISYDDLTQIVTDNASHYRLTEEQINNFHEALKRYQERHDIVEKYRKLYPKTEDLFRECFGSQPKGQLDVVYNPCTIHFVCHHPLDYANAYGWNEEVPEQKILGPEMLKIAFAYHSRGASTRQTKNAELENIVTISRFQDDEKKNEEAIKHEEQHQLNLLFEPQSYNMLFPDKLKAGDESAVNNLIKKLIRYEGESIGIDNAVRDEVLAQLKGGKSPEEIFESISKSPSYDFPAKYFKEDVDSIPERLQQLIKMNVRAGGKPVKVELDQIQSLVINYFRKDYENELKKWIDSIKILEDKSYTREEIINLLYSMPLTEWQNLARIL